MNYDNNDKYPEPIYIDSCAFNPSQPKEAEAMEKLWELDEDDSIQLMIVQATDEEMKKAPAYLRDKASSRVTLLDMMTHPDDRKKLSKIEKLLFPDKPVLKDNDKRDARNLFCVQKQGGGMFVTVDKKDILSKAPLIKAELGIDVVSPTECYREVMDELKKIKVSNEWRGKRDEEGE